MKKKGMGLLLAVLLLLALVGCASSGTNGAVSAGTSASLSTQASASVSAAASGSAETPIDLSGHSLSIYCGAGMTKPFQEIADEFKAATGCEMAITFANAAQIQTQINTAQEGDLFIAGSAEEVKPVEAAVTSSTPLVKHIPVIAVQAGNPKHITCLKDLAKNGVEVIIGDPTSTPIGKIAQKAFVDAGIADSVTISANTTTAPAMATAIAAGSADAAIVWKENCDADGVEIVDTKDMDAYIKTVPAAALKFTADEEALSAFLTYLGGDEAHAVWQKYGYELAG